MSTSVFCPTCANLLLVEACEAGSGLRFCCATCPYVYNIDKTARAAYGVRCKRAGGREGGAAGWRKHHAPSRSRSCTVGCAHSGDTRVCRFIGGVRSAAAAAAALRAADLTLTTPPAPVPRRGAQITHVVPTQKKDVDDVLGGEEAWRNVDATAGAAAAAARRGGGGARGVCADAAFVRAQPQRAARSALMTKPSSCKSKSAPATSQ
jgi:DNA-directed RNA polymerase subunit M/transcription elongation factor TFIIS